jgi:hypothetical protein
MASSTSSSSNMPPPASHEALPMGLRLTAADRPGVAQPVPERDIDSLDPAHLALGVADASA